MTEQLVRPCLWIATDTVAAIETYCALIPNSRVVSLNIIRDPWNNEVPTGEFELAGVRYEFIGGPGPWTPNGAFSLSIVCDNQAEIDHYWDTLVDGGEPSQCGWLTDRWGISWQVTPRRLAQLLWNEDPAKAEAARQAMFGMSKLIIAELEAAGK